MAVMSDEEETFHPPNVLFFTHCVNSVLCLPHTQCIWFILVISFIPSPPLPSPPLPSPPLPSPPLHSTPLHSTPLHSTPLHSTPLHSIPFHFIYLQEQTYLVSILHALVHVSSVRRINVSTVTASSSGNVHSGVIDMSSNTSSMRLSRMSFDRFRRISISPSFT